MKFVDDMRKLMTEATQKELAVEDVSREANIDFGYDIYAAPGSNPAHPRETTFIGAYYRAADANLSAAARNALSDLLDLVEVAEAIYENDDMDPSQSGDGRQHRDEVLGAVLARIKARAYPAPPASVP